MRYDANGALATHEKIRNGELSALEVLDNTFTTIEKLDGQIGAFNFLTRDLAYQTAEAVDKKVKAGEPLPLLAGVPLALKDNIHIKGCRTTISSKIL